MFGTGTLSSSDGQRFPTRGKSVTARALSRYFVHEGLSTYTHVTDQYTTYGTKIVVAAKREAHYVLDEILGNATDIPITERPDAASTTGGSGPHFPGPLGEHQLLRRDRGRHRRPTRPARPHRLPAVAVERHALLTPAPSLAASA
nr:transposase [Amycolatopsis rhizosphaerae]